jgi:hypothetical protein
MVQIPDQKASRSSNGNDLLYEEIIFKDFVEVNGSKNTSKNLKKITFASDDGREWVIWGKKEELDKIFAPIEKGNKIKIGYKQAKDRFRGKTYNNVKSIEKIENVVQPVQEEIKTDNNGNNGKSQEVDNELNLPNLHKVGQDTEIKMTREELRKRLTVIETSLISAINFLKDTVEKME